MSARRFAVFAALILTGSPLCPQAPPPMFSASYVESLRDIAKVDESDARRLERKLAADPEDFTARLKLMAYYDRADRVSHPEDRARRVQCALWLIEHHPDSEILHSGLSHFTAAELMPTDLRRATALWDAAAKTKPSDAAVQWNAASFFRGLDNGLHLHYLEATAAADPNHPFALRPLAYLYALTILDRGPLAPQAQAGLDASKNVWVVSNAAYMFQSQYNQTLQLGSPNHLSSELAERYFLRAKALNPNLDRSAILPQIDMKAVASKWKASEQAQQDWAARAAAANREIRRLPVNAFPELPPIVAGVLQARDCRVPQASTDGAPRNVIRGKFFDKGEFGWAVLCSVNSSTSLLAFRNDRDTQPDTIVTRDDLSYLQGLGGDKIGFSREITAVGSDFIIGHYRAYGGPEPPRIQHQGIDDAFLGKASVTWYFHNGKWMQLTGAD